jgi:coenzyme PQQ precursor peptide PqqA
MSLPAWLGATVKREHPAGKPPREHGTANGSILDLLLRTGFFSRPGRANALDPAIQRDHRAEVIMREGAEFMAWKTPVIVEIALGAEINSYACADAKK